MTHARSGDQRVEGAHCFYKLDEEVFSIIKEHELIAERNSHRRNRLFKERDDFS